MQEKAKQIVFNYVKNHIDKTDNIKFTLDNIYVVWFCKTLQNWKALVSIVSATLPDGIYYEITYNGNTGETYVDVYKKWENYTIKE